MAKDLTGSTLGKYQVMERLGRGGMADVYRAYQPGMDRYVAIKVMHSHLAEDENFITRFRREAQSVGNLRHPNIVQVIDFDVQDDEHYMVMEYIQGETLKSVISRRGTLPIDEALNIGSKLADALAYAHSQGMIHRDLKPANVLFTNTGNPVLMDFGIARLLDSSGLTSSGAMVGTPAYMSPEAGRGEKVDERADIYSLGVVLYEMLTGSVPFDADTPYAVILKHINDPLPIPRQFNKALPDSVERLVLKALAKNPNDRFQAAAEMRTALERAKESLATERPTETGMSTPVPSASEATVIGSAESAPRRNLLPLAAAGVVGLIVIVGIAVLISRPQAALPTTTLPTSTTAPTNPAAPTVAATQEVAAIPSGQPASKDSVDAALVKQILKMIEDGNAKGAMDVIAPALKANPQSYDLLVLRSFAAVTSGDETLGSQALQDAETAAQMDPKRPEAYFAQGVYYQYLFRPAADADLVPTWKKAVGFYNQAIDLKMDDYHPFLYRAMLNAKINDYTNAESNVPSKVIEDDYNKAMSYSPQNADAYLSAGSYFFYQKKYDQAQPYLQQTLVLYPESLYGAEYLASVYLLKQQSDKAFQVFSDGITRLKMHDPRYLADAAYVAWAHASFDQAKDWASLALSLEPHTPAASYVLALLAWHSKHHEDALNRLAEIAKVDRHEYDEPFLNRAFDRDVDVDRARIFAESGHNTDAIAAYEAAKKVDDSWLTIWIEQAKLYQQQGQTENARQNLRRALDIAVNQNDDKAQADIFALLKQIPTPTSNSATPGPTPS